jgi:CheY-like chemotaxis protein
MRRQASVLTIQSRAKKDQPPDQPTANTTNPADLHILVVEDNLVNQRVLAKQLRNIGMKVTVSNHGGEALEHLQTTQYCVTDGAPLSIVLMDWEMPVKSLHPFKSESHTNFPGHERLNMRAIHPRATARRRYTWACACYCRHCKREVGASGGGVGSGYGRCYLEAV